MLRTLVLAACSAGCIDATYQTCGTDICPTSSVCLDGVVCATPNAIASCAMLADATPCHADLGDGYCTHGACVPNVCGDGRLTGIEQCDGSLVSVSCKDLGYYAGDTACSPLCTIDRSSCSGRCGDGIVQADQGEECDSAPPAFDCPDIGFDYGALTCAVTCASNPTQSCSRFGWHKLGPIGYPATVVGDAGMYAIRNAESIEIHDATVSTHPGMYISIDALGGDVLVATATSVERYHAGAWIALADPALPANEPITEAKLADDGTAFVLATGSGGCSVGSFDGSSWTIAPGPPSGCVHVFAFAPGDFIVSSSDGTARWHWPGCDPTIPFPCGCYRAYPLGTASDAQAFAIRRASPSSVTAYSNQPSTSTVSSLEIPQCGSGPGSTSLGAIKRDKFVLRGTEVFGANLPSFGFSVDRLASSRDESFAGPPSVTGEPPDLWATRDGVVYAQGDGSLWRLGALTRSTRSPPGVAPDFRSTTQIAVAADGTFVQCDQRVLATSPTSGNNYQTLGTIGCSSSVSCCTALFARSATSIYASLQGLYQWDGGAWTQQTMIGSLQPVGAATSIAGNADTAFAVTSNGVIGSAGPNTWVTLDAPPSGCTIATVAVSPAGAVYAGGGCTAPTAAVIWRYQNAWIEIQRDTTATSYSSLSVASDETLFAASGPHVVVGAGGAWTTYDLSAYVVSAVTATDAFATNAQVPTRVLHFDGMRWTPINVDPTQFYFAIAASPTDVFVYGTLRISQPYPAMESFVRVP